jgi:DNA-binding CsgD family transcriptional regulator
MARCSVTDQAIAQTSEPRQEHDLRDLTAQERRILALVGEGRTNRQIGARMHLAEKTVKKLRLEPVDEARNVQAHRGSGAHRPAQRAAPPRGHLRA